MSVVKGGGQVGGEHDWRGAGALLAFRGRQNAMASPQSVLDFATECVKFDKNLLSESSHLFFKPSPKGGGIAAFDPNRHSIVK